MGCELQIKRLQESETGHGGTAAEVMRLGHLLIVRSYLQRSVFTYRGQSVDQSADQVRLQQRFSATARRRIGIGDVAAGRAGGVRTMLWRLIGYLAQAIHNSCNRDSSEFIRLY